MTSDLTPIKSFQDIRVGDRLVFMYRNHQSGAPLRVVDVDEIINDYKTWTFAGFDHSVGEKRRFAWRSLMFFGGEQIPMIYKLTLPKVEVVDNPKPKRTTKPRTPKASKDKNISILEATVKAAQAAELNEPAHNN